MAVTGDRRRRTLFDEDQGCYRTSSGNREKRFGRGCVQTLAAVDGGRSIPPTPLFSGPSDGEREYQRWNAHRRVRSPPPSHRYLRHHSPPSPSSSSSQHPIHIYHHQPSSPSINSSTHSRRPNQSQKHHTRETYKPQFHRFENTHENQFETTKTHSRFSHHNSVTKYKPPNHQFVNHQTKTNTTISLISLTADHENQFSKTDCHSIEIHFQPQNMASTNFDSKPRPTLPRNRSLTLTDMMHFVSNWFDFEEKESAESERINRSESELSKNEIGDDDFCDVLGDRVVNCVDSVQEKVEEILVDEIIGSENIAKIEEDDDFDLAREVFDKMPERDLVSWNVMISGYLRNKNLSEARELFEAMTCRNVGSWNTMITGYAQSSQITLARNLFDRSPLDTIACDSVRFAEPVNDKIVLSVLIGQIVSTLDFGFENVKTKGVRRRQWQIAWASLACHWTIVLVPLWLWVALRRDFSVGVYHSHKPNRGLRSIVGLLVHFPRASTELEVEFFSKKGRLM